LQAGIVRDRILEKFPECEVVFLPRTSRGDRLLNVSLSALDGSDFFTEEIFNALKEGEADLAVHSLKDMSAGHFFSHNAFAVVDRDDVHDVAIFNSNVIEKLRAGIPLKIGTCSPRREEMAMAFLKKALPQLGTEVKIEVLPIRGNVEGRLHQLDQGKYDGTLLATAGLNRLLKDEQQRASVRDSIVSVRPLLSTKRLMLLPLIECIPAPSQGSIVVEADPSQYDAVELLGAINVKDLLEDAIAEKKMALEYGTGCLQKFGVTTIRNGHVHALYAAGEDQYGKRFEHWSSLPKLKLETQGLFNSVDHMKDFFNYEYDKTISGLDRHVVFISNHKSLQSEGLDHLLRDKMIWASGSKTWFALSKAGHWVHGAADGLGFEHLINVLSMPLYQIHPDQITIITHDGAAARWTHKGFHAVSHYRLVPSWNTTIISELRQAKAVFWTSYAQYQYYGAHAPEGAVHLCPSGETATLLKKEGLDPYIFPTIKSFEQWRMKHIQ
jgi:porphobilinogen deaminase